jgi:hypothetical protein
MAIKEAAKRQWQKVWNENTRTATSLRRIAKRKDTQMTKKMGWGQVLKDLFTNIQTGVVGAGFRGELLSKILCLVAVDRSQPPHQNKKWDFTRRFKVSTFLSNLIRPPGEPGKYNSVTACHGSRVVALTHDGKASHIAHSTLVLIL